MKDSTLADDGYGQIISGTTGKDAKHGSSGGCYKT